MAYYIIDGQTCDDCGLFYEKSSDAMACCNGNSTPRERYDCANCGQRYKTKIEAISCEEDGNCISDLSVKEDPNDEEAYADYQSNYTNEERWL